MIAVWRPPSGRTRCFRAGWGHESASPDDTCSITARRQALPKGRLNSGRAKSLHRPLQNGTVATLVQPPPCGQGSSGRSRAAPSSSEPHTDSLPARSSPAAVAGQPAASSAGQPQDPVLVVSAAPVLGNTAASWSILLIDSGGRRTPGRWNYGRRNVLWGPPSIRAMSPGEGQGAGVPVARRGVLSGKTWPKPKSPGPPWGGQWR